MRRNTFYILVLAITTYCGTVDAANDAQDPKQINAIVDSVTREWLEASGAPSASIALVRNSVITYAHAYGEARLAPALAATTSTRYAIDSVSKEFTAAAVLILAEQGKLSLDDTIGKWFTNLGDASRVTVRQLLTHTSGIRDFWPQDFLPPEMLLPTSTTAVMDEWVRRPLDFEPGTDWQYSNTGYVVAGAIVEKVSGETLMNFLQRQVFAPLKMDRVTEDDTRPLPPGDAAGYTREGLGPTHPAPKEGAGWLFAAAELAMAPGELALWDISLMNRSLLKASSYDAAFNRVTLKDGRKRDYGLGLSIVQQDGRTWFGHDGSGSGFCAANRIWPDEKTAVIVLTNSDWANPDDLVDRIAFAVLPPTAAQARARAVFSQYQRGKIDRTLFTEAGNHLLTAQALADLKASLEPLGPPRLMELRSESKRGGMITRIWKVLCRAKRLEVIEIGYPDGKLEEFRVTQAYD